MKNLQATELALKNIINLVINHHYKPGDQLLETNLVRKLNMSRTPIRDALGKLAYSGFLLKIIRKKGYFIPSLTPKDMRNIFQIRSLLESYAVVMAIKNISDEELENLRNLNKKEKKEFFKKNKGGYANINQLFHLSIAKMSNNPYLYRCIEQVIWRSSLYSFFFAEFYKNNFDLQNKQKQKGYERLSHLEHKLIIQSIADQDEKLAEKLIKEHIEKTYKYLVNPQFSK